MKKISKATKAEIITNIADLKKESLGKAGKIEQKRVGEEEMTYIEECDNPKAVTILLRGGTEQVTEEIKRAMEDSLGDVKTAIEGRKAVAGAGSTEIELARNIQLYSEELSGREQLAVKAFAEAIEIIPKTLAENAGLDPIDIITELKLAHNKGNKWTGINIFTGKMMDAWKEGVIEPLKIKTQAISSATEVANMILRIDDIIIVGQNENPKNRME
jgi:chaperonin GroEL (HSP60 family)